MWETFDLLWLFRTCLEIEYTHTAKAGSFAVLRRGEECYIFFEKSNGAVDWYHNLSYGAAFDGAGYSHEGFFRVFSAMLPALERQLSDRGLHRLVTVGYSHGAALALLCHEHFYRELPQLRPHLYGVGYGCPRVKRGGGERAVWRQFLRVVNCGDLVTALPPRLLGYRHVGRALYLGEKGRYSPIDAHREESYLFELENLAGLAKALDKTAKIDYNI